MELSLKGICKSFGGVKVLDQVDFDVRGGEICALIGENGAGKSTLMKIIGGVHRAEAGKMLINGNETRFASPAESLKAGIAFIHQELNLVNDLTVYENIFLSGFLKKGVIIDKKSMIRETGELFARLGVAIDPCEIVGRLDASYKQIVEIVRAIRSNAEIIIMDEPTASLTASEIDRVFGMMRTLKENGIGMVFISHKLDEVMEICDRFTVLRNGTVVKSGATAEENPITLASYMVGRNIDFSDHHKKAEYGEEVLKLDSLSDGKHFFDVSLSVRRGEVLGVTGILGDGHSELFTTVFGYNGRHYTGKIFLSGKEIHPTATYEALGYGLAYLPKNRKENGIISDMTALDNGTVVRFPTRGKVGILDRKKQKAVFDEQVVRLRIKASRDDINITKLSGGNQQKVVLTKWLLAEPEVLVLDNPTQGVDIAAKNDIYSIIESLAASGIAVVVLSSEAKEIIRVCDRAIVMYHGRIAGELGGAEMNESNIMILATGAGNGEIANES